MGLKNRIRGFIKADRPLKLKSYISSHDVDLDSVNFGRGQRALHLCALYGSGEMLRCLLRLECDAAAADKDGNLPLHLALQRALHGHQAEAENLLSELVRPLQQAYPLGQDVENRNCETGHDMLISLRHKIKIYNQSKEQQRQEAEKSSEEENERWRRRLEEESLFEYAEQLPRYSADDDDEFHHENSAQSFDKWSEHIREEMSRKRKSQQHIFWRDKKAKHDRASYASSSSKENPHTHDDEGENLKRAREEMQKRYKPAFPEKTISRLLVRKQRYEKKFTQLLSNLCGKSLTFACIPWPHVDVNCVADVLFCDLPQKKGVAYRKYLRSQQVRWHPDKFTQKFGEHLHPDHAPKIMARVKTLSQLLNKLESERTL